ncbi:MAG: thiamine pyrophosphate-dependent enzyme [Terracidiphilus sp.]|jgi:TPP-dependent pyruvate/acetoin dehydrogenase alpha subunit
MTKPKSEIAPEEEGFSLIPNRKLLAMYAAMLQCRRIAQSSRKQSKTRSPADSILGHEAAAVGATFDLGPRDTVAPSPWPDAAFKAINPSVVVASGFALAARSALANKDNQQITLLFSTGKAGSQSSWLKALAVAAERDLPILFVSLERETNSTENGHSIPLKKNGYAMPFISVDGNDVVAVYRVASEAITHARKGNGPTLIDCRISSAYDPLENMKKYLIGKGLDPGMLTP